MRNLAALALVGFIMIRSGLPLGVSRSSSINAAPDRAEVFLLVLLEADTFLCSPCLDRLLAFCRAIPSEMAGVHLGAVILCPKPRRDWDKAQYRRMIGRRAESVFQANRLTCPLVVDDAQKWSAFASQGPCLLVLDGRTRSVQSFPLPLEPGVVQTLLPTFQKGGDPYD